MVRPPVPLMLPLRLVDPPLSFSTVPPPPLRVIGRVLVKVDDPVMYKVPPSKVRPPVAAPRLLSADTESVPPSMDVPPLYVFVPDSVRVPIPTFTSDAKP